MILSRFVYPRARRMADMVASVPDDTARIFSNDGMASQTALAKSSSMRVGAPNVVPKRIVFPMVSKTSGCA